MRAQQQTGLATDNNKHSGGSGSDETEGNSTVIDGQGGKELSVEDSRITVNQSINEETGDHRYIIRGIICSRSEKGCNETLADDVYAHVNQNDIPFTDDDLGSGPRVLIPGLPQPLGSQPIIHSENIRLRTSVNITLDGHNFHPGDVTHRVHFENGRLYYDLVGTGTGSAPKFNNWIGIKLFKPGVENAVNKFRK